MPNNAGCQMSITMNVRLLTYLGEQALTLVLIHTPFTGIYVGAGYLFELDGLEDRISSTQTLPPQKNRTRRCA